MTRPTGAERYFEERAARSPEYRQARELALRAGIVLVDGDALGGWVTRTGPPPWLAGGSVHRQTA